MGRDKSLLPVDGVPMAARVAAALRAAGAVAVWAQGGDATGLAALGLEVRADSVPGGGPLPATLQALGDADTDVLVVLSCDLVRPSPAAIVATVAALVATPDADGAVPLVDGHRQWTHAAWRRGAAPRLADARAAGAASLQRAAAGLRLVEVPDLDPTDLADADRPADLGR